MTEQAFVDLTAETLTQRQGPPVEITGYLIGRVDTKMGAPEQERDRPKPRWSVNTVWKLRDGSYVLVRESWSRVYHTEPTTCMTAGGQYQGDVCFAGEMFEWLADMGYGEADAVPCWKCHPPRPRQLPDQLRIRYEFVRRSIDRCALPAQVIDPLIHIPKHDGRVVTIFSRPVKDLLEQCADNDPDWEEAERPVERIG